MNINKKFKDSVFTALFNDPASLRELYCALGGVPLPQDVPVSINTLENVLYMDLYNDISFEIGGKLVVLIEHQSTINPNMALRLLIYVSKVLEKRVKGRTLYSRKQVSIPWPEFYVLYNGAEPFPDSDTLKLSDLFEKPSELGLPGNALPMLELEVNVININEGRNRDIVININEGRNRDIVSRCRKLAEYSALIACIRNYVKELGDLEGAVREAVKYCERHGILSGFLEIHGSEVLNMILTEWNTEDAIAFAREEGRTEGHEQGRSEEKLEIARNLKAAGVSADIIHQATGLNIV